MSDRIVLRDVSKFYGEVLGINRVQLDLPPGLTGLVGPNGAGKSTLMHLMTGLLRPSRGTVRVLGVDPADAARLNRIVGYCSQYDGFPDGATGLSFVADGLRLHGLERAAARSTALELLDTVGLADAARRRIAGYSKGMRQRVKIARAISHEPRVLVLDEPLNGLDPVGRAELTALFREWAADGRHVLVSSHILHEVDAVADTVVMIHGGSVVAEGTIRAVRSEITSEPIQVLVRCDRPGAIAAGAFGLPHVVEARILDGGEGVMLRTRDADALFAALPRLVLDTGAEVETVMPADEDVHAVYKYLIGDDGGGS